MTAVIDEIFEMFDRKGHDHYGEGVSQLAHALQCAWLAEQAGAGSATVVAALLHDIGHLMEKVGPDAAARGIDGRHEDIGAAWLARRFGPEVTDPVKLHVDAKRYLCAVRPGYYDGLSEASKQSLAVQGGPFSATEAQAFSERRGFEQAIAVRLWDDQGKVLDLATPELAHFRTHLEVVLNGRSEPRHALIERGIGLFSL